MMRRLSYSSSILAALVASGVALNACGKKDKKDDSTTASSLAELKLSSALNVKIPAGMKNAGGVAASSLSLEQGNLAGKKSSEACRAMDAMTEIFTNLAQASSTLCHMEVEADRMKFGTKYEVHVTGVTGLEGASAQILQLWVDNTDPANLKVYTCNNGVLSEKFEITGFSGSGKAKGTLSQKYEGSDGGYNFSSGINLDFDMTQDGISLIKASMKGDMSGAMSGSFRRFADIKVADQGVSSLLVSAEGSNGPQSFSDQVAMNFDGTVGQSLYSGTYNDGTQSYPAFTSRSTFDANGAVIDASQASAAVVVDKTKLPAKLASDFAPAAPSGWDCKGTSETIEVNLAADPAKKIQHDKCEVEWPKGGNCWGDDFDFGTPE